MIKKILCILAVIGLTSCATPTPYQPENNQGGFSELALNRDTYVVNFRGNQVTSSQVVNNYLLRRSAEIALSHGYKYFVKLSGGTSKQTSIIQTPTTIDSYKSKHSRDTYTTIHEGSTYEVNSFTATATIKLLHSNVNAPDAYDAAILLGNFMVPTR